MSICFDFYPFACPNCNYESNPKSEKAYLMVKRLHAKKCLHAGRTEKSAVVEEAHKKKDQRMAQFHNGGEFMGFDDSVEAVVGRKAKHNTIKKKKKKEKKALKKKEEEPKKEEEE